MVKMKTRRFNKCYGGGAACFDERKAAHGCHVQRQTKSVHMATYGPNSASGTGEVARRLERSLDPVVIEENGDRDNGETLPDKTETSKAGSNLTYTKMLLKGLVERLNSELWHMGCVNCYG